MLELAVDLVDRVEHREPGLDAGEFPAHVVGGRLHLAAVVVRVLARRAVQRQGMAPCLEMGRHGIDQGAIAIEDIAGEVAGRAARWIVDSG